MPSSLLSNESWKGFEFVDLNPDFEVPVERLATWLARLDDEDD